MLLLYAKDVVERAIRLVQRDLIREAVPSPTRIYDHPTPPTEQHNDQADD